MTSVALWSCLVGSWSQLGNQGTRNVAGCGLQNHDKRGWQVLVTDKVPELFFQRKVGKRAFGTLRGVCKVD